MRKPIKIVLVFLMFLIVLYFINSFINPEQRSLDTLQAGEEYEKGQVITVENLDENGEVDGQFQNQIVTVKMLTGTLKGKTITANNTLSNSPGWDIIVEPGDKVIVCLMEQNSEISEAYICDMARSDQLKYLFISFVFVLVLVGGLKGIKSVIALGLAMISIYQILLPALLKGFSPLPVTILILIIITPVTLFLVGGVNRKSLAATAGTLGGVLIAGLIALLMGHHASLSGLADEESRMLLYIENLQFDMQGLLFSGIIIGALGAIMDVAMSIASAIDEVRKANPRLTKWQLIGAGINVGRDIMGTMANTLILAYTGGALPFFLLFMAYQMPGIRIFNSELIATEIVRSLGGSIGLVFTIPITAIISGYLLKPASIAQEYRQETEI
ncbi:MAG: YibE/F family protein [Syntrophomonadaceae bacterium]